MGHLYPRYVSGNPQLLSGWAVGSNRGGRPQGSLPAQPRGCRLRTLPCARSGQGGLGGCHPRGGGRRRSVGSNDLQRTQKQSFSWALFGLHHSRAGGANCTDGSLPRPLGTGSHGKTSLFTDILQNTGCLSKDTHATQEIEKSECIRAHRMTVHRQQRPSACCGATTVWEVSRLAQSFPTSSASAVRKALLSVPAALGDLTDPKAAVAGFFLRLSRLVFSAQRALALTPEQDLRLGTTWGTRWRSSYHAAGFGEALGGPGCTPCGQTGRAGPLGLRYPGSSCWGLLAPLKGENRWHEGRLLLEQPLGGGEVLYHCLGLLQV